MIATGEHMTGGSAAAVATLWGLTPQALHDRLWSGAGVRVVRLGAGARRPAWCGCRG